MSREFRLFAAGLDAPIVELPADQAHHALHVLRLGDGAEVEVFDGAGTVADGRLRLAGKGRANVEIVARRRAQSRPEPWIELAFAVPKGKRLDWLLEKAAELGVARVTPVVFERSVVQPELSDHARQRWLAQCISAAKQCHTDWLPEIGTPADLPGFLAAHASAGDCLGLMGDPDATAGLGAALQTWRPGTWVSVLIGPEGGITPDETAAARAAGFASVRLGRLILRAETAAIALLAGVNVCLEERSGS